MLDIDPGSVLKDLDNNYYHIQLVANLMPTNELHAVYEIVDEDIHKFRPGTSEFKIMPISHFAEFSYEGWIDEHGFQPASDYRYID